MKREYDVDLEVGAPTVNYREMLQRRATFDYLFKKQTGGQGMLAGVVGYMEPISSESTDYPPSEFVDATVGMNIPPEYISAVEKGFYEVIQKGPQTGYPVINTRYVLEDGRTHSVDSSTLAFMIATKHSFN